MVSADAEIWLAFLRNEASAEPLRPLLHDGRVSLHPFVLLERSLRVQGPDRGRILSDLQLLVACHVDPPDVVSAFIEQHGLADLEVDIVGAHLLASAVRCGDQLWARDRDLGSAVLELKV